MNADERRSEGGNMLEEEKRLRDAVMIYAGLIFCEVCSKEACPEAPVFTEEQYTATARRLWIEGWRAADEVHVYCPECFKRKGSATENTEDTEKSGGNQVLM